jgi:hypothetical protein
MILNSYLLAAASGNGWGLKFAYFCGILAVFYAWKSFQRGRTILKLRPLERQMGLVVQAPGGSLLPFLDLRATGVVEGRRVELLNKNTSSRGLPKGAMEVAPLVGGYQAKTHYDYIQSPDSDYLGVSFEPKGVLGGLSSALWSAVGVGDVSTGDAAFDERWSTNTNRPEFIEFLSPEFRALMLRIDVDRTPRLCFDGKVCLFSTGGLEAGDNAAWLALQTPLLIEMARAVEACTQARK